MNHRCFGDKIGIASGVKRGTKSTIYVVFYSMTVDFPFKASIDLVNFREF